MPALTHQEARAAIGISIAVVAPFALRTIGDSLLSCFLKKCIKVNSVSDLTNVLISPTTPSSESSDENKTEEEQQNSQPRVSINGVWDGHYNWEKAIKELGIHKNTAVFIACIRLLFWHWLQPFLYAFVFFAYYDLLDVVQRILGFIVAGREGLYWMLTVIAIFVNPVYLLVDLRETWTKDTRSVGWVHGGGNTDKSKEWYRRFFNCGVYVLAPEKYVALALFMNDKSRVGQCFVFFVLPVLDMAGAVAIVWAIMANRVYWPLMIGYIITTIGGVFLIVFGSIGSRIAIYCQQKCGCDCIDKKEAQDQQEDGNLMFFLRCLLHLWILSFISHAYHVVRDDFRSWHDAQEYCESECHSDLASVHSDDDMNFLQNLTASILNANGLWIGLNDLKSNSEWEWIDGSHFNYGSEFQIYPWSPGNPSNGADQNCVWIWKGADYQWDDYQCDNQLPFVCNECSRPNYYLSPNTLSLNNANYYCIEHCSSTLASIHSVYDNQFAINIVSNGLVNDEYDVFLGLYYSVANDQFKWTDGSQFDFGSTLNLNGTDNPWDSNTTFDVTSPCVVISASATYKWQIRSGSECSNPSRFLCNSCDGKLNKVTVVHPEPVPFNESQMICRSQIGTDMVSIHDGRDFDEARSLCEYNDDTDCWIGLKENKGTESIFQWEDGTEWDYGTTLGTSPWKHGKPDIDDDETQCVGLDKGSGFRWEDDDCLMEKDILCNAPMELCYPEHWLTIQGDDEWQFNGCAVTADTNYNGQTMVNTAKKWVNQNGILQLELLFKMDDGTVGVTMYNTLDDLCSFWYIGISETMSKAQVFIMKYNNSMPSELYTVPLNGTVDTSSLETVDSYYRLKVRVINGTEFDIWVDGVHYISFIHQLLDTDLEGSIREEVMIGLKISKANLLLKSLYVSGTAVPLNNVSVHTVHNDVNVCDFPTSITTPSPIIVIESPTQSPTPWREDVVYGLDIRISFEVEPMIGNNTENITSYSSSLVSNTAETVSHHIWDILFEVVNVSVFDCIPTMVYDLEHNNIINVTVPDDPGDGITMSFGYLVKVCDRQSQMMLKVHILHSSPFIIDGIMNISVVNVVEDSIEIEVKTVIIDDDTGTIPPTTAPTITPHKPLIKIQGTIPQKVLFILLIVIGILFLICCVFAIRAMVHWRRRKKRSVKYENRNSQGREYALKYSGKWDSDLNGKKYQKIGSFDQDLEDGDGNLNGHNNGKLNGHNNGNDDDSNSNRNVPRLRDRVGTNLAAEGVPVSRNNSRDTLAFQKFGNLVQKEKSPEHPLEVEEDSDHNIIEMMDTMGDFEVRGSSVESNAGIGMTISANAQDLEVSTGSASLAHSEPNKISKRIMGRGDKEALYSKITDGDDDNIYLQKDEFVVVSDGDHGMGPISPMSHGL